MDVYSARVLSTWAVIEEVVAIRRRGGDSSSWENFEYLVVRAREWERQFPNGSFPKSEQRLQLKDKWLAQDRK
jgi:hypothetical protein